MRCTARARPAARRHASRCAAPRLAAPPGRAQRQPARPGEVSPFRRLATVHALLASGDCAMAAVLVGSVFISSPDAARSKVLLFQLISVAPFAIVAPLVGPTVDRMPGGRRIVVQITAIAAPCCSC